MTDKELTIWEHLDSVMRVLTSKEMGAWLYRRDKRVLVTELEKIKAELNDYHLLVDTGERDSEVTFEIGKQLAIKVIDEHIDKLKGE